MDKELTFHINNLAYTFKVDEKVANRLSIYMQKDRNLGTKDLLSAVVKITQEYVQLENSLDELSKKLPQI